VASPQFVGDDVFIGADGLGGAMHGDRVRVRVVSRGHRGPEGEIVEVVDRAQVRVAGVLRRQRQGAWLEPDDARVRGPIVLREERDQAAGASNNGQDGDAAVVRVTRFPMFSGETAEGVLEAVLGRPGELRVEIAKVLVVAGVPELHSEAAVREAEAYGSHIPEAEAATRDDLRHLPLPTIDPEDARDHDDAVWVERTRDGGYLATIAIADVSTYVTPQTALDREALARGCTIYLPDRAIPMLPRALSSNLCSLLPNVDRLCLAVQVELDSSGSVVSKKFLRGVMRSAAKLTYGGVARALGLSKQAARQPEADELVDGLRVAYELSRLLRARRKRRGSLDFEVPEPRIELDAATGLPTDVTRRGGDAGVKRAYELIEDLMLLANESVASHFVELGLATVFRVHEPPDEKKVERLAAICTALGVPFDPEEAKDPKSMSAVVARFRENAAADVLNMILLRSMKQAVYDVSNLGHFGLAAPAYLHFTSPIRRYPDLVVHRMLHALIERRGSKPRGTAMESLREAAMTASAQERKAMEIEREVVDLYRTYLMRDHVGQRFEGTVTGLSSGGAYVMLDAPFVDVHVRYEDMGGEGFTLDELGISASSPRSGDRVSLGDRMVVEILDAAILRRTVFARRVEHGLGSSERKGSSARGRAGRRGERGPDPRTSSGRSTRGRSAKTSTKQTHAKASKPSSKPTKASKHSKRSKHSTASKRTKESAPSKGRRRK
jgi:ribonuclease R